jgi:hypothetical protein
MNEQLNRILTHKATLPTAVGFASFVGGAVCGYILGKRNGDVFETSEEAPHEVPDNQLTLSFEGTIHEELPRSGFYISGDYEEGVPVDDFYSEFELETDAELAVEEEELEDAEPVVENVFKGPKDNWDYEAELSTRSGEAPYVIHFDEFSANEMEYTQSTVTYYEGDDILADEYDTPMYRWENNLGELNWGHGSNDANVVYIRNETLEMEWEVLRHTGRFEVEVLGLEPGSDFSAEDQLVHSWEVPRFRKELED